MVKVSIKKAIKHGLRHYLVPYLVPSWCSSCLPERNILEFEQDYEPTLKQIKRRLNKLNYEIKD